MPIVGIDLGTTNTLVSVMEDGIPETLANEFDVHLTPSAVAVAADGGILVGRAAWDRLAADPAVGRAFFKRDMGTPAKYRFGGRAWTPTECSAVVLQEMKRIAEMRLDTKIEQAVITVPAYFREEQRQATMDAAHIAGLSVARIINEPTAAALAYGYRDADEEKSLLVFDLGGGTFDVTVLEVFAGVIEVQASGGDSRLGGEDYTDALLDMVLARAGVNADPVMRSRIRRQVESVKRRLSVREKAALSFEGHELVVSRKDLADAGASISERMRPVVVRCMRDAGIEPNALEDVLLVGGASRMHIVGEYLGEALGRPGAHRIDPDRVVALGAAVQAALCERDSAVEDVVLTDVCAHTLGISVSKELIPGHHQPGYFEPLIDRNTTVPVSRSKVFNTIAPQQDQIIVEVYQGENRMSADNNLLGKLRVSGLRQRPGQKRPGEVEIRFTYDMNGLLEVEATVLHSGKQFRTVIEERPGALSPQQIERAMQRLAPLKIHPRDRVINRARLERANRLFAELSGDQRQELGSLIEAFEAGLERQEEGLWEDVGRTLDEVLSRYYRQEGDWQPGDDDGDADT